MTLLKDILPTLPDAGHIEQLVLEDADKVVVATLNNVPGTAGSVRVYHALAKEFGYISKAAAQRGLELYAEHTEDARQFPGKHPNIDRLFAIINNTMTELQVKYSVQADK